MKRLILLCLILCASFAVLAQENWASASLICQTESEYRVLVTAQGAVDTVLIIPNASDGIEWVIENEYQKIFNIPLENEHLGLVIYAWGGAFQTDTILLAPTALCGTESEIPPPIDISALIDAIRQMHDSFFWGD